MEEWEREYILQHQPELVQVTKVRKPLLDRLRAAGVFGEEDVDDFVRTGGYDHKKSTRLYNVLLTRAGGFQALTNGLLSDNQIRAYRILQQGRVNYAGIVPTELATTTTLFASNLPHVENLVDDDDIKILVVITPDPQLSLKRIKDVGKNCLIVDDGETARSLQSMKNEEALVIPCDKIGTILGKVEDSAAKVVLLTRESSEETEQVLESPKKNIKIVKEEIRWSHLTPDGQKIILQQKVIFQNQVIRLEELPTEILPTNEIKGQVLIDLLSGMIPELVKKCVPHSPAIYIPRKIVNRTNIYPGFFQTARKDVFVVDGIDVGQLATLTRKRSGELVPVAESSQQLNALTAQFIQLESPKHYERICELSKKNPVHLLSHSKEGEFLWRRSHNSLGCLRKYFRDSQNTVENETSFVSRCLEPEGPICIADSPEMGETPLLTRLAEKVMSESASQICCVVRLVDLISKVKYKSEISVDFVCELIANSSSSSDYELGRHIVIRALKSEKVRCHLFLQDHHRELWSYQVNAAKKILDCVRQLKNTQLYVSTLMERCHEFEDALVTLAFHVKPLDEEDQVTFLAGYWSQVIGAKKNDRLDEFAKSCLTMLKTNMTKIERDIMTGILLQCRLIAEVCAVEAKQYSEGRETALEESLAANLFSMFHIFMIKSFSKVEAKLEEQLRHAHVYYAIKLLFPEIEHEFKQTFVEGFENLVEDDSIMLAPGIVEEKSEHENHPRFIQSTLAEYLVAQLVQECLKSTQDSRKNAVAGVLLRAVFSTNEKKKDVVVRNSYPFDEVSVESQVFEYPVICYFLNSFMSLDSMEIPESAYSMKTIPALQFPNIFTAAVAADLPAITSFIAKWSGFKTDDLPWSNLFLLAAKYAGVDTMFQLNSLSAKHKQVKIWTANYPIARSYRDDRYPFQLTPLHVAVHWGNYNVTIELLQNYGFGELLVQENQKIKNLLHFCVVGSYNDDEQVLNHKIQVINWLCSEKKDTTTHQPNPYRHLLEEKLSDGTTPLLQYKVHAKLIQTLIHVGADVNVVSKWNKGVLHRVTEGFTPIQFHELVDSLSKTSFKHYDLESSVSDTPLRLAIINLDIELRTVHTLLNKGANINQLSCDTSILYEVLRRGRSKEFVHELAVRGANLRCKFKNQTSIVPAKVLEAVEYVIETTPSVLNSYSREKIKNSDSPPCIITAKVELKEMETHQLSSYVLSLDHGSLPIHTAEPCFVAHSLSSKIIDKLWREDCWGLAFNYNKIQQSNVIKELGVCTAKVVLLNQELVDEIEKVFEETGYYPIVTVEEIQLLDLSRRTQQLICDQKFSVQCNPPKYNKILNTFFLPRPYEIRGKLLFDLTIKHQVELLNREMFNDIRLPLKNDDRFRSKINQFKVYGRRNISTSILSAPGDDVFVVKGLELRQLASLSGGNLTDKSSNQTSALTAKCIQLEYEDDFEKICSLSKFPVHLLAYHEGNLGWVRSHGSLSCIQQHVHKSQQKFSLATLLEQAKKQNSPTCFVYNERDYDEKFSVIAALMNQIHQNPTSVVFCLASTWDWNYTKVTTSLSSASPTQFIAEMLSDYSLGRQYVTNCLQSEELACHLILCYDDDVELMTVTKALLSMKPRKNIQLHFIVETTNLVRMEGVLQTLGFGIEFGDENQLSSISYSSEHLRFSSENRSSSSKHLSSSSDIMKKAHVLGAVRVGTPKDTGRVIPGNVDDVNIHKSQMEWIRANLDTLVQHTECTDTLVDKLKANCVINETDAMKLMSMEKSKLWKTLHMYQLLEKHIGSYNIFLKIILSEKQIGAYQILQQFVNNLCNNNNEKLFRSATTAVMDFLSDQAKILIISTPERQVSLKRIKDTLSNCVIVVQEANAEEIGKQLRQLVDRTVLVVSCNKLEPVLRELRKTTKKVIITTELDSETIRISFETVEPNITPVIASEKLSWADINPSAHDTVLSQPIIFQENLMTLKDLSFPFHLNQITEKLLLDLLTGKCPELVKNTVPPLPAFPLKRQLLVARKISRDVVKNAQRDIFIIKGGNLTVLETLAHGKATGVSSKQLDKVTAQVILLHSVGHVEKIYELAEHPVHLLSYGRAHLTWISSYGSHNVILQHVLDRQKEEMNEEKFIEESVTSEHPVCIAGESGMGKSVWAKVGQAVMNTDPNCVVCYVVLKSLIHQLEHKSLDSIFDVIAKHSSDYELGREIVKTALTSPSIKCHVLLDGHGETSRTRKTNRVARHIAKNCHKNKNRLTMTSRKSIKKRVVGTPTFEIVPIPQKDILIHYWTSRRVLDNLLLHQFAEICLKNLYGNMTDFERGISENISLCNLLAEVHLKEAKDFSTRREVKGEQPSPSTTKSIFELHQRFTDSCFEELQETLDDQGHNEETISAIQDAHMFHAIDFLYQKEDPGFESFKNEFYRHPSLLVLVGEMIRKDYSFVYKSVAEYLVGLLVLKFLKNPEFALKQSLAKFLFGTILATLDNSESILNVPSLLKKTPNINSSDFKNSAVCYFFNSLLKSQSFGEPQCDSSFKETRSISFHKILVASVLRNFYVLGQFIIKVLLKNVEWKPDWPKLLMLTAKYCDGEGESHFLDELKCLINNQCLKPPHVLEYPVPTEPSGFTITPLHIAIEAGNTRITEFLLDKMGFESFLQDSNEYGHYLLHMCLYDSEKNPRKKTENKIKILNILCKGEALKSLAIKMASEGTLHEHSVHPNLVDALSDVTGCRIAVPTSRDALQNVGINTLESQTTRIPRRRSKGRLLPYPPPQIPGCSRSSSVSQEQSVSLVTPQIATPTRSEDDIKSLVVGDENCPLGTVVETFRRQLDEGNLCDKLLGVALSLQLPQDTIVELRQMLRQGGGGEYHLGCDKILRAWVDAQGKKATLGVLMKALAKSHQNKLCEHLMDLFKSVEKKQS